MYFVVRFQSTVKKLINAKYCDKFAHVLWKDGQMMHVHVTPEFFRLYKDRLGIAMDAMQRRFVDDTISLSSWENLYCCQMLSPNYILFLLNPCTLSVICGGFSGWKGQGTHV